MVEGYLINAFRMNLQLSRYANDAVQRPNLTIVTSSLCYKKVSLDSIDLYINTLGAGISVQKMGDFQSLDDALICYKEGKKEYLDTYAAFKKYYGKDSDWNMVLIVDKKIDKIIVTHGYCVIPSLSHFSFTTFLDMCVIYESTDCVKTFFDSFRAKSNLTKYESFQLGFYLEGLNAIKDPSLYYVNKNEIELANEFYDLWKITNTCESLINTITSTIDVFSFTFQYQTNKKEKLSSKMFAILTIILGFTTLYDFFDFNNNIQKILVIIFAVCVLGVSVSLIWMIIKSFKEYFEYRKHL